MSRSSLRCIQIRDCQCTDLLQDILTLSKLDARLLEVTPTEVDPVETVKHALRLYQQECQNADIDSAIRVDQSYNSLAVDRVYVDPSRLLQVLINLLGKTDLMSNWHCLLNYSR